MIRLMRYFARLKFFETLTQRLDRIVLRAQFASGVIQGLPGRVALFVGRMSISVPYKSKNTTSYLGVCVTFSITGPFVGIVAALPAAAIATLQPPPLQINALHALYTRLPQPPDCERLRLPDSHYRKIFKIGETEVDFNTLTPRCAKFCNSEGDRMTHFQTVPSSVLTSHAVLTMAASPSHFGNSGDNDGRNGRHIRFQTPCKR